MARRFDRTRGDRLIIASHNAGKVAEIAALVGPLGIATLSAGDLGLDEPEETGATFLENAALKAAAAAHAAGEPALADDSGLVVPALDGAPGIYSARWAGPDRDFALAMEKVHRELAGAADRSAYFACALALVWPDGHKECFEGQVHGVLTWPPRGDRGFGYDPMFLPLHDGQPGSLTFGEMEAEAKHRISHRAAAFRRLIDACFAPVP
ncbi:MAG: RdgB/HAM1 family non-canonical purine NTP pyrophosphatase [Alphaproteobacteria bacterium]|nr:RdgB/HAM1 family non-canonical purine NTP pyrophosphatase [Alphaproteobacteria bacterium]